MPRWAWRFALALVLVGGIGVWQLADRVLSLDWQQTEGEITRAEIRQLDGGDDRLYYFSLRYRYRVDGQEHIGRRATVSGFMDATRLEDSVVEGKGNWLSKRFPIPRVEYPEDLAPYTDAYPAGQPVTVHYDPEKPTRAALTRQTDWRWVSFLVVLLIMTLIAALAAWIFGRLRGGSARRSSSGDRTPVRSAEPARRHWGLVLVGVLGLVIASCSYYQERQAAATPPAAVALADLCGQPDNHPPWARVTATVLPSPRWQRTGLAEPAWASCPQEEPMALTPPLQFQQMMDLQGCVVAIEGTGTRTAALELDPGPPALMQQAHLFTSPETSAWTLAVPAHEPAARERQRWVGRLTLVRDLRSNRPELGWNWQSLAPALAAAPFVILSDRPVAVPNLEPPLHLVGQCAVITVPHELAAAVGSPHEWWVRPLPNARRWPGPFTATRPLLLRAATSDQYQADRTFWWRGLRWFGQTLALFGLVPVLIAGIDWLRGR